MEGILVIIARRSLRNQTELKDTNVVLRNVELRVSSGEHIRKVFPHVIATEPAFWRSLTRFGHPARKLATVPVRRPITIKRTRKQNDPDRLVVLGDERRHSRPL